MTTSTLTETFTGLVPETPSELREGYTEVGDMPLHYVEAGDGPLVVLLHGFPEFWYGWRAQIAPLAAAGSRVVAPDLRGYNLSVAAEGRPGLPADKLAEDIGGLIRELGYESGDRWSATTGAGPSPGPSR